MSNSSLNIQGYCAFVRCNIVFAGRGVKSGNAKFSPLSISKVKPGPRGRYDPLAPPAQCVATFFG